MRDVAIPPHLIPLIKTHIAEHASWGREGLIFPSPQGVQLTTRPCTRRTGPHGRRLVFPPCDFTTSRHTGRSCRSTGATLAEFMARLGHSTPAAALRYQHASEGRDQQIAKALSELVKL